MTSFVTITELIQPRSLRATLGNAQETLGNARATLDNARGTPGKA